MKINHLTPDLLRRYAAGLLTPAEQHAVERLLLDDPLAAEAVEGLARLREDGIDGASAGADLQARLRQRVAKRAGRVIPLTWTRYAAAAVVLVGVAGLGWWSLRTEPTATQSETTVSASAPPVAETAPAAPAPAPLPELAKARTAPPPPQAAPKRSLAAKPESLDDEAPTPPFASAPMAIAPPADTVQAQVPPDQLAAQSDQTTRKREAAPAAAPARSVSVAARRALTGPRFTGRVIGENQQPVAGATVMSVTNRRSVATDALGRFFLPEFNPNDRLRIAAVGYQAVEIAARDTVGTVTLQPNRSALSEVVVTGNAKSDSPAPEGGFSALDEFIRKNRRVAGRGRVTLSFRLSTDGRPERVRVQASDSAALNAEAIRLLTDGPRWTVPAAQRKNRVVYEMKFE